MLQDYSGCRAEYSYIRLKRDEEPQYRKRILTLEYNYQYVIRYLISYEIYEKSHNIYMKYEQHMVFSSAELLFFFLFKSNVYFFQIYFIYALERCKNVRKCSCCAVVEQFHGFQIYTQAKYGQYLIRVQKTILFDKNFNRLKMLKSVKILCQRQRKIDPQQSRV